MSQASTTAAGPSGQTSAKSDPAILVPQAVIEYLQQHGFDKALATYKQELEDRTSVNQDGKGGEDPSMGLSAAGREAIFRAPGPIPLDNLVKRNIPQASTMSASTLSEKITPEFVAQAKYIVDQLTARAEAAGLAGEGASRVSGPLLDPSDRLEGYRRYRRWVDDGLDIWKVGLVSTRADKKERAGCSFVPPIRTYLLGSGRLRFDGGRCATLGVKAVRTDLG
jgi:transcription initiation factor TFIID subunit 5